METRLSKAVLGINPSPTEATSSLANRMRRDGIDIISFAQGEPDFDTPPDISLEAVRAVVEGYTRYTDVPGMRDVREAVAEKFGRENGIRYTPSEVMISNGGKQILYLLFRTICDPGDEVVVPTPCYVSYEEQIRLSGASPVFAPVSEDRSFRIARDDIEPFITPRTKAVIINSPNNPTGAVCEESDLRAIAALAAERGIFIVTDEVYEHLLYDGRKHVSIAALGDEAKRIAVTVNSASKTYAMTGWRIGYAGGPEDVISGMITLQGHVSGNVCSVAQRALSAGSPGAPERCCRDAGFLCPAERPDGGEDRLYSRAPLPEARRGVLCFRRRHRPFRKTVAGRDSRKRPGHGGLFPEGGPRRRGARYGLPPERVCAVRVRQLRRGYRQRI